MKAIGGPASPGSSGRRRYHGAVDVPNEVLRPGLEAAFIVATLGPRMRPPVPAPAPLRAFLRFQKLPTAALAVVRKVVEEDDEFRARVTAVATEETVNRASWLWLHRPEGWELELADLIEAEGQADGEPPVVSFGQGDGPNGLQGTDAKARRLSAGAGRAPARSAGPRTRASEPRLPRPRRGRVWRSLQRAGARGAVPFGAGGRGGRGGPAHGHGEPGRGCRAAWPARRATTGARGAASPARGAAAPGGCEHATGAEIRRPAAGHGAAARCGNPPLPLRTISLVGRAPSADPQALGAAFPPGALDALGGAAAAAAALAASLQDLAASLAEAPPSQLPAPTSAASAAAGSAGAAARPADIAATRPVRRRALRIPRADARRAARRPTCGC